jgi:tRNA pseudouridine38-40 synthase
MRYNIQLIIAYEGTRFLGWQKTKEGPSIEEEVQKALEQILQHPVQLQAASRTDAGVHAKSQVVNFFSPSLNISPKNINGVLPKDISVLHLEQMPEAFHPTLDCIGKEYFYDLCLGHAQLPFHRNFSWHFPYPLDLHQMEKAAAQLIGEHDFSAFTSERQEDNRRQVTDIGIIPLPNHRLRIRVAGNRFLYKMVRTIVGTLIYVGCGKIEARSMTDIVQSKDRTRAGVTAPAHGLALNRVFYDFTQ